MLQRSNEDPVGSQNQHGIRTFAIENKSLECGNSGDLGKINFESVSCLEQENALEMEVSCNFMECRSLGNQVASKTLILFEDFDATLDEDRGLIATIVELAETTKRPIILTSNSGDPILPPLVDRVTVNFTLPSVDELVSHAYMICVSEATNISLQLIERVVRFCRRDIRKTLMFLQFWCQGRTDQGGNKSLCAYGPVPFNIDAGHYVIKKVIPWGLPSQLSEYIEQEVSKSLAKTKAIALDETITEELSTVENLEDRLGHKNEDMSNEDGLSKWKSAMHDFALESSILSDISPCKTLETTKQSRQKRRVVVSDSEDEPYIDKVDLSEQLPLHLGEESLLDVPNNSFSMQERPEVNHLDAPNNSFSMQERPEVNHLDATLHENLLGGPKTNGVGCTHYLNGSPEISCIPGLSFVPETEIDNGYLEQISSVACFPDLAQNTCLGSSDMLKELGMEIINPAQTDGEPDRVSETLCWDACDTAAESVLGCNDCHFEPPLAIFRTCPLIDECSRADFSSSFMNDTKPKRLVVADLVQETWKKLRSQGSQIRFCIETEQSASSSLKIASGLTQLISDADVMLTAGCVLVKDPAQASIFDEGDRYVDLMSTFAEHGLCFYAKKSAPIRRHLDPAIELDLASEILVSSMDSLTMGKLVAQESGHGSSSQLKLFEELMEEGMLPDRLEDDSMFSDALLTVVPIRSYLASRGAAFHEYLSFLSQISKGESTRLAQEGKTRRCGRYYVPTRANT
ncbi:ATPase family AAA domain-containing protein 5 [Nymphaea thermarum]|nr:ATPase family AAA domain-containing protein 5 [Nymphaea thermarum]